MSYLPREKARCCHGDCNQGRDRPVRQSCELPEDDRPHRTPSVIDALSFAVAVLAALALLCAPAAILALLAGLLQFA